MATLKLDPNEREALLTLVKEELVHKVTLSTDFWLSVPGRVKRMLVKKHPIKYSRYVEKAPVFLTIAYNRIRREKYLKESAAKLANNKPLTKDKAETEQKKSELDQKESKAKAPSIPNDKIKRKSGNEPSHDHTRKNLKKKKPEKERRNKETSRTFPENIAQVNDRKRTEKTKVKNPQIKLLGHQKQTPKKVSVVDPSVENSDFLSDIDIYLRTSEPFTFHDFPEGSNEKELEKKKGTQTEEKMIEIAPGVQVPICDSDESVVSFSEIIDNVVTSKEKRKVENIIEKKPFPKKRNKASSDRLPNSLRSLLPFNDPSSSNANKMEEIMREVVLGTRSPAPSPRMEDDKKVVKFSKLVKFAASDSDAFAVERVCSCQFKWCTEVLKNKDMEKNRAVEPVTPIVRIELCALMASNIPRKKKVKMLSIVKALTNHDGNLHKCQDVYYFAAHHFNVCDVPKTLFDIKVLTKAPFDCTEELLVEKFGVVIPIEKIIFDLSCVKTVEEEMDLWKNRVWYLEMKLLAMSPTAGI